MCYRIKQAEPIEVYANHYKAPVIDGLTDRAPYYHANGFEHPKVAVLTENEKGRALEIMQWGLMANWNKPLNEMLKLSTGTLNASQETIFEKRSYKNSIMSKRCIVIVDGIFEFKHVNGDKLPFFIFSKGKPYLELAGIYSFYQNTENKEWIKSFSIVTTKANEFMASIHNTKKRMPVMLETDHIGKWLAKDTLKSELEDLMIGNDDCNIDAYQVDRNLISIGNHPKAYQRIA